MKRALLVLTASCRHDSCCGRADVSKAVVKLLFWTAGWKRLARKIVRRILFIFWHFMDQLHFWFYPEIKPQIILPKKKTFGICCCNISFSLLISTCSNTLTYTPWTKCRVSKNRHTIFGACLHRFTSIQSSTLGKVWLISPFKVDGIEVRDWYTS